jgi:hypothetical protein
MPIAPKNSTDLSRVILTEQCHPSPHNIHRLVFVMEATCVYIYIYNVKVKFKL